MGDVAGRCTRLGEGGGVADVVAVDRGLVEAGVHLQVLQELGLSSGTCPLVLQLGGSGEPGSADLRFRSNTWKGQDVEEKVHVALRSKWAFCGIETVAVSSM